MNKSQKSLNLGEHFSKHIHGMFLYPRATIRKIVKEPIYIKDLIVPGLVVVCAGVLSALGLYMWKIIFTQSLLISFLYALSLVATIILLPTWYIFLWIAWSAVFHFLGSIVSGRDITDWYGAHKTLKLVGFCMIPAFLNILPLLNYITPFWIWGLCMWAMEINYNVSKRGAFVIALPMLFVATLSMFSRSGLL